MKKASRESATIKIRQKIKKIKIKQTNIPKYFLKNTTIEIKNSVNEFKRI